MSYLYVEAFLIQIGNFKKCEQLPEREAGQTANPWLEDVREVVSAGLKCRKWDTDFAADMTFCAEMLAAELRRYPSMVAWDQELYVAAVESGTHPEDEDGMRLLTEPKFFDDDTPLDAETLAFLRDLTSGDGDEARS